MPSSSTLVRWGTLGAVLAGLAWIAALAVSLVGVTTLGGVLGAYLAAWAGTLVGVVGLHARQAPGHGWLGLTGFYAAFVGAALALVGLVLTLLGVTGVLVRQEFGDQALGLGFFVGYIGIALFGVGFVLWGVAILLARSMPLWCGVLMIAAMPVACVLSVGGSIGANAVLGLLWLALGYALWSGRGGTARRTTHSRPTD